MSSETAPESSARELAVDHWLVKWATSISKLTMDEAVNAISELEQLVEGYWAKK